MKNLSEMWPTFLEWVKDYVDGNADEDAANCVYSREDMRYAFQAGYELALDIQTKNIKAIKTQEELFFVGYTNGAQVLYATEDSGSFYKDTDNDCYIPLYMLKAHEHRLKTEYFGGLDFDVLLKARKCDDS